MAYAESTKVPVMQTKSEIDGLLRKYKALSVGLHDLSGLPVADVIAMLTTALGKVPEAYRAGATFDLQSDYDTGPEGFDVQYERPKTADELAADERGRLRHLQDELDRARRNMEEAEAALRNGKP